MVSTNDTKAIPAMLNRTLYSSWLILFDLSKSFNLLKLLNFPRNLNIINRFNFCKDNKQILINTNIMKILSPSERLKMILSDLKTNKNALSKELGYGNNVGLTNIENNKYKFSTQLARRIVAKFPQFNYEWIISGKGERLNNTQTIGDINQSNIVGNNVVGSGNKVIGDITLNEYRQELDFFKKETARLSRLLEGKDEQLSKKDEQISRLLGIIEKMSK
jgi:DNA-binding XRE family transcriptional regulator